MTLRACLDLRSRCQVEAGIDNHAFVRDARRITFQHICQGESPYEHGDKSPCVQGVKPQILKYPHQLQPPITLRIWIHQLLHLCQHASRVRRSRLSIKKLCASSLSSPKSACNSFKAIMTSVTAQSGRSFNMMYLKEQGLHGLAGHESP
jgi:hypothetical protein